MPLKRDVSPWRVSTNVQISMYTRTLHDIVHKIEFVSHNILCYVFAINCAYNIATYTCTCTCVNSDPLPPHHSQLNSHTHTPYTQPPPQLRPFNTEQFLKSMEGTGPHLTTGIKGNWNGLYRRFLDSPNFVGWYTVRKEEANQKLRLLHLDQLCKAVSSGSRCGGEPLLLVVIIFILLSCAKL